MKPEQINVGDCVELKYRFDELITDRVRALFNHPYGWVCAIQGDMCFVRVVGQVVEVPTRALYRDAYKNLEPDSFYLRLYNAPQQSELFNWDTLGDAMLALTTHSTTTHSTYTNAICENKGHVLFYATRRVADRMGERDRWVIELLDED